MSEDRPPADYAEEPAREPRLEDHVTSKSTWLRALFMLVVLVLWGVSRIVVGAVILLQFLYVLLTGRPNDRLLGLGRSLAVYTYQVLQFLTYNSDERPFPFDLDWPLDLPRA